MQWKSSSNTIISDFSNSGHEFDYIDEINIVTIVDKRDRTYDFYNKHNMHAVERKLNRMLKEKPILTINFKIGWRHP